jgi:hypothetical protein
MTPNIVLRGLQVGDIGWVAHRQGILYAKEYGWDGTFEALVAEIAGQFVKNFDPEKENAWIAECEGRVLVGRWRNSLVRASMARGPTQQRAASGPLDQETAEDARARENCECLGGMRSPSTSSMRLSEICGTRS